MDYTKNESGLQPRLDFILLRVIPPGETKGGLVTVGQEYEQYVVVAKGPGRVNEFTGQVIPTDVPIGKSVCLISSKFSSAERMHLNGCDYVMCRDRDLMGEFDEIA